MNDAAAIGLAGAAAGLEQLFVGTSVTLLLGLLLLASTSVTLLLGLLLASTSVTLPVLLLLVDPLLLLGSASCF